MKNILLCLFLIFALGCKKNKNEQSNCYVCKMYSGGQVVQTKTVCTDREDTLRFSDANGNPYSFTCDKK